MKKTSVFSNGLIWFGAAVSIAEILTGTLIASLGFLKGLVAIILGHFIGCVLLYFAGLIGAKKGISAMETVKISFGQKGSILFSSLNVLQLIGWTAVMIIGGAKAIGVIANPIFGTSGEAIWCLLIGALIILWILVGIKSLDKLNIIVMLALFILTIILSFIIFNGDIASVSLIGEKITFGTAVELSVAMPISWLPLISDYTRDAAKPKAATIASVGVYFVTSCWMYAIGMGAAIFTGESDITTIIMKAGLGFLGILTIILSTVTTTVLDVYSAGVSSVSISKKLNEKVIAIIVCAVGIVLAIFTPIEEFENFLYLIGSVFVPMIAIQIVDVFILKNDNTNKKYNFTNLIIWLIGFIIYRIFLNIDTPIGNTLPVMIITAIICISVNKIIGGKKTV